MVKQPKKHSRKKLNGKEIHGLYIYIKPKIRKQITSGM